MSKVTILDYGVGNLFSVSRALSYVGASVTISSEPEVILKAHRLIIPGVGAFPTAMSRLNSLNLTPALKQLHTDGIPILGICLGMQLLLDCSHEHSLTSGLSLIPGSVQRLGSDSNVSQSIRVPHIGWKQLEYTSQHTCEAPLLNGLDTTKSFYFVHSFHSVTDFPQHTLATTPYSGVNITSIVASGNTYGCQFHPEKSGHAGLQVLSNFTQLH